MKRLALLALILAAIAAAAGWWIRARLVEPYRGFTEPEVFVELAPGSAVARIADRLAAAGVVRDPWAFRIAARLSGAERRLQAGEYRFAEPASAFEVVNRLARGDVYAHPVTFPEGLTVREMAAIFEGRGFGTAAEFERAASDPSPIRDLDPAASTLEGYLFPDTYAIPRRTSAPAMVALMVQRFRQSFGPELRQELAESGFTLREVVTLASLIEKETAAADERTLVAAVYRNRLRIGMPLQADPTVIYALMAEGRWNGNITRRDLQLDSPYNTYRYAGLPPGPIASPGLRSLEAALSPADVPYLYFVSRNDGTHVFASTLGEHNRNVQEWQVRYFRRNR